jgi:hypothetical protein
MTDQELTALKRVLDYLAEEEDDYDLFMENGCGKPDDHIFFYIQILKKYIQTKENTHD